MREMLLLSLYRTNLRKYYYPISSNFRLREIDMVIFIVIAIFIGLSFLATLLVFASVMLSSRISQAEENPGTWLAHADRPQTEASGDLKRKTAPVS